MDMFKAKAIMTTDVVSVKKQLPLMMFNQIILQFTFEKRKG